MTHSNGGSDSLVRWGLLATGSFVLFRRDSVPSRLIFFRKFEKKSLSVFYLLLFNRWKLIRILPGALKRRPLLVIKVWWITVTLRLRDSDSIFWFDGRPNAVQEQSRAKKKWQETV